MQTESVAEKIAPSAERKKGGNIRMQIRICQKLLKYIVYIEYQGNLRGQENQHSFF